MKDRMNGTAWVVFHSGIQELARITAAEATPEEISEARALIAWDYCCHPDEIEFRLVVDPFAAAVGNSGDE